MLSLVNQAQWQSILVITGSKIGRHCFKIVDGIGSSAQHFSFLDLINIDINRW